MQKNIFKIFKINYISLLFLLIGLFIFCYPMFISGGQLLPGGLNDTRILNYMLEHGYQYFTQQYMHSSLFDMPMFYPRTNTLSYSDMLIGEMFIYVPIRFFINNPQDALKIWFIFCCIINYVSMFFLLRKVFNFNTISSSIGAFLFSFALPRQNEIGHIQLLSQFYMILSLISFFSIKNYKNKIHNNICFLLGFLFFVIQIYTSFYLGWYMVYGFIIYLLILITFKKTRLKAIAFIKKFIYEIILYSLFAFILLIPMLYHYLAVNVQFGYNDEINIRTFSALKLLESDSILQNIYYYIHNIYLPESYKCGMGFLSTILIIYGIYTDKKRRKYIFSFIFLSLIFFINPTLNYILYHILPGASAVRLGLRIIFLLLPLYSIYLAYTFEHIKNNRLKYILLFFIIIEHIGVPGYLWSKEINLTSLNKYKLNNNCIFIYNNNIPKESPDIYMVDTVWFAYINNKYPINGFSGFNPNLNEIYTTQNCIINQKKEKE